jgi:hypothetical protein
LESHLSRKRKLGTESGKIKKMKKEEGNNFKKRKKIFVQVVFLALLCF